MDEGLNIMSDMIGIVVFSLIGFFVGCMIGLCLGFEQGLTNMEKKAITLGVAEWVPDEEGMPIFTWKENEN